MKALKNNRIEPVDVFLGGTCADSTWRKELIPQLEAAGVTYFNPQLGPGEWNEETQETEDVHKEQDNICLYVITPKMVGLYSLAEVVNDSIDRPEKCAYCIIPEDDGKAFSEKQLQELRLMGEIIKLNGATVISDFSQTAYVLSNWESKEKCCLMDKILDDTITIPQCGEKIGDKYYFEFSPEKKSIIDMAEMIDMAKKCPSEIVMVLSDKESFEKHDQKSFAKIATMIEKIGASVIGEKEYKEIQENQENEMKRTEENIEL